MSEDYEDDDFDETEIASENVEKIIEKLTDNTEKSVYTIVFDENKKTTIFDSKLRGVPYWDLSKEYPLDKNGNKMLLVAQVNFANEKIDEEDLLPKTGILQFFHTNNEEGFASNETDYKIVYHKTVDESVTEEQILALNIPLESETCYIEKELPFSLKKSVACINYTVNGYEEAVLKAIEESYEYLDLEYLETLEGDFLSTEEVYYEYEDELKNHKIEDYHTNESSMLGYPEFTQDDLRKKDSVYDTVLFKFDSSSNHKIEIGDSGVANIFINSEKLKNLDFSDIFYTWDCC